ncbi:MAG: nitroreductase family protein [Thermodesulfobacteriota bacterium]|nr:nitroreductase family protein [Thermodesulfobacteriota bacterium]
MITYSRPVTELIQIRTSARTHTGEAIAAGDMDVLTRTCGQLNRGLLDEPARFQVLEKSFVKGEKVKLGNYGLQKNPRYFFVGGVHASRMTNESYGYLMEQLVLKATELGLGTCWIGFFDRTFFHDFQTAENEEFPAACTVGHAANRRLFEKVSRAAIRADKRKDREMLFFEEDFTTPLNSDDDSVYSQMLEMVRLAPSAGNSQPWRVVREKGTPPVYHFFMNKASRLYARFGLHNIDMGIAMCHFELTARELGAQGIWQRQQPVHIHPPADTTYTMTWVGD